MIERLAETVNADAALVRRGQYLDTTFLLQIDADSWLVTVEKGRITRIAREGLPIVPHSFALRPSRTAWTEFFQAVPKPGYHDLVAMTKFRQLKVDGDITLFMTHLQYLKDALATLRVKRAAA